MFCRSLRHKYEQRLLEYWVPGANTGPKRQFDSRIEEHFAAEDFPHRSCIARAGIPNVQGLIRSEMMAVTGMMISAMREKKNEDVAVIPVRGPPLSHPLCEKHKLIKLVGSWSLSRSSVDTPVSFRHISVSRNSVSKFGTASCTISRTVVGVRWTSFYGGSSALRC